MTENSVRKVKYGAFQKMNLQKELLKGILTKGYKTPTPIQRKMIPVVMDGKDVVATARTGSGKSAAFIIPILCKLNEHSSDGPRALIISPTRELAIQTLKFTREIGRMMKMNIGLILGGNESLESQFKTIHEEPDILICTPGRLLHVMIEMTMKFPTIEMVVFDEADRLFELGFQEQLHEILKLLPSQRQSMLVSATLPTSVIQFSKVGLNNPSLIRLDGPTNLSPNLSMQFIYTNTEETKLYTLLHLLTEYIKSTEKTMIFVSTKYHVDYLKEIFESTNIRVSVSYSAMDGEARKENLKRFSSGQTSVMIVTDIAARGLDIPLLDNVINFNYPKTPKLFVHRVGRVARMDRVGFAYSLFTSADMPYILDLHDYLMRDIKFAKEAADTNFPKEIEDGLIGAVPNSVISNESCFVSHIFKINSQLIGLKKKTILAERKVKKFNEQSEGRSVKISKDIDLLKLPFHPIFKITESDLISRKILHADHIRCTKNLGSKLDKVIEANNLMKKVADKTKKRTTVPSKNIKRAGKNKITSTFLEEINVKPKTSKFTDSSFSNFADIKHEGNKSLMSSFDFETQKLCLNMNNDDDEDTDSKINKRKWDSGKNRYIRKNHQSKTALKFSDQQEKSKRYTKWEKKTGKSESKNSCNNNSTFATTENSKQLLKKRLKRAEIKKKSKTSKKLKTNKKR